MSVWCGDISTIARLRISSPMQYIEDERCNMPAAVKANVDDDAVTIAERFDGFFVFAEDVDGVHEGVKGDVAYVLLEAFRFEPDVCGGEVAQSRFVAFFGGASDVDVDFAAGAVSEYYVYGFVEGSGEAAGDGSLLS